MAKLFCLTFSRLMPREANGLGKNWDWETGNHVQVWVEQFSSRLRELCNFRRRGNNTWQLFYSPWSLEGKLIKKRLAVFAYSRYFCLTQRLGLSTTPVVNKPSLDLRWQSVVLFQLHISAHYFMPCYPAWVIHEIQTLHSNSMVPPCGVLKLALPVK